MQAPDISQVQTDSRTDNQLQQNIIQGMRPLLQNILAINSLQTGLILINGTNTVNHGLMQTPVGMIVVNANVAVSVYGATYNNKTASFTASAASVCDVLFF